VRTFALQAGSAAIDAGANAFAVDAQGVPLTTDARGFERFQNDTVDVGAYEVQSTIPTAVSMHTIEAASSQQSLWVVVILILLLVTLSSIILHYHSRLKCARRMRGAG
jgi:phage terminase large subunit-like protein